MNTFGMKVKARCFMEYDSVADLVDIEFEELARPVLHIGGGSNLLFTDDFKGTVLHSKIDFIEILDEGPEVLVSVGAGVVFDDFIGENVQRVVVEDQSTADRLHIGGKGECIFARLIIERGI